MTRQEFIDRTGLEVNEAAYKMIEPIYMLGELDKDAFCKMWDKMDEGERLHLEAVADTTVCLSNQVQKLQDSLKKQREELGKFLADEAEDNGSKRARAKAIELLGFKGYITYKVEMNYEPWEEDMKDIIKHLA